MQQKCRIAAGYPTRVSEICAWAERTFPDTLPTAPRAHSEMRKYNGGLSPALLCDNLLLLDAYVRLRQL